MVSGREGGAGAAGGARSAERWRGSCDESSTMEGRGGRFSLTMCDSDSSLDALVSPGGIVACCRTNEDKR